MLPLFKVFSLIVRVFARPVIARTKAAHLKKAQSGHTNWVKRFYVRLGNFQHKWDQKIDSKFMGIDKKSSDFFFKPMNDEVALEKGVEFFYEILIYALLITLPTYEMYSAQQDSKKKSEQNTQKLNNLMQQIEENKQHSQINIQKLDEQDLIRQDLLKQINIISIQSFAQLDDLSKNWNLKSQQLIEENQRLKYELEQLKQKCFKDENQ
ncbi:unnamed protein product [Paramecium pentaurelia]|uniref:Transmembrane protein n=1 Tax=Paramecium pentaurelia TaxID=43138 RepID=A0A8S1TFY5_9CILI|nr:unnamed protein product [Paramecium pentaurelia]